MSTDERRDIVLRRIVVGLDASPPSQAALKVAVVLAARCEAELVGLFVEDANLLRLVALPFAAEMGGFSARRRQLDAAEVERELRAHAGRVRRILQALAEPARVRWEFRVARGTIASELTAAAAAADLVILGKAGWSLAQRGRLGSTARAVLGQAQCLALIVQQGTRLGPPTIVIYDGSPAAGRALAAAVFLAGLIDQGLTVLVLADDPDDARLLESEATAWLAERGLAARYRQLTTARAPHLGQMVRLEGGGTLVLPAEGAVLRDERLLALLDEIESPVLLVR